MIPAHIKREASIPGLCGMLSLRGQTKNLNTISSFLLAGAKKPDITGFSAVVITSFSSRFSLSASSSVGIGRDSSVKGLATDTFLLLHIVLSPIADVTTTL
ncbi:hypothetical protein AVEN_148364-1 [Araneus ventricosus]|uniref:Uncharacterized protein n=1 Tax=Araneus ventricosus TaxID=182803 RepID=A0A4Y2W452_ARAVE|nr:hypothetical protein AVEN_148364-1 [Araneus ventricosus]